ncbi:tyrosine-protein phosphatase non-receptor type substrate 1-like [Trichomycterus rosablanca]|uniref:tyrosine-protein phosphatase non-receptor type substrate 1-like n=1 Tax=Trichomycterus rosablanca TaxID=2290929 RepID=UPI002F35E750
MLMLMWITVVLFNTVGKFVSPAQTNRVSQPDSVITATVGDNVTLRCFLLKKDHTGPIVWYKQTAEQGLSLIASVQQDSSYEEDFRHPRFNIKREKESFHLNIASVEPSDEASYYCGSIQFLTLFGNGTFLSVRGDEDVKVSVNQHAELDSVPAGESVNLQCSVLSESKTSEHQVLWFRSAEPQSHPQIIYTHHNSSHQCKNSSSTYSCVYNFSKNILTINDTGTYYCAVAICGKIIFGNGTTVQLAASVDSVVIYVAVILGVLVAVFSVLVVSCKMRTCEHCRVRSQQGSVVEKSTDQDCDAAELNYIALHFTDKKAKKERGKRNPAQDCVYSTVRDSFAT